MTFLTQLWTCWSREIRTGRSQAPNPALTLHQNQRCPPRWGSSGLDSTFCWQRQEEAFHPSTWTRCYGQIWKRQPDAQMQRPLTRTLAVVRSSRCEAYVVYAHVISSNYSCISTINKLQRCFHSNQTKRDDGAQRNNKTLNVITFYVAVMFVLSFAV